MKSNLALPPQVQLLLRRLNQAGFQAYAVGGCVRDALCGITPHDWDICTSAAPQQTQACFSDCRLIETGLKHGTVTVLLDDVPFEITTFRTEGAYSDHRRPDSVAFVTSLEEDLSRRDFTINAMAYHPNTGVVDLFGGREDLSAGLIRCVGSPRERFREDGLRMLRALRFAARFQFRLEVGTAKAVHECRELLAFIAMERIFSELKGILSGVKPGALLTEFRDVFPVFLPQFQTANAEQWAAAAAAIDRAEPVAALRLALLLTLCHEPGDAKAALERLRCDNQTRDTVRTLLARQDILPPAKKPEVRKLISAIGQERAGLLARFYQAALIAPTETARFQALLDELLATETCFTVQDLQLSGRDLIQAGHPAGKALGRILNDLLDAVLTETIPNDRQALLDYAETLWKGAEECSM